MPQFSSFEKLEISKEYFDKVSVKTNELGNEVEKLSGAFIALKSYVDNYFDNLDVQEEINNKLDEMAESGQLTDIIAQYLGLAGMIAFDTVADMKLAQNLVNGSKCRTLGYYSVNDGGGAYYKIRQVTNDDVVDEMFIIEVNDDNLVGELITDNLNIKQLGANGVVTNDTKALKEFAQNYPCVDKIELLPLKKICQVKYDNLGIPFPLKDTPVPSKEQMEKLNKIING